MARNFYLAAALLSLCLLQACHRAAKLPPSVAPAEVEVLNAWLSERNLNAQPSQIYVLERTMPFSSSCNQTILKKGVPRELVDALSSTGGAMYEIVPRIPASLANRLDSYGELDNNLGKYISASFSRVALSTDGKSALFRIAYPPCNNHRCSGGRVLTLLGKRRGKSWRFDDVGCLTIID